MSAIDVLARAAAAGVTVVLEDGEIVAEAVKLQPDVVATLRSVRRDLMCILTVRRAAEAALAAEAPDDCGYVRPVVGKRRWKTHEEDGRETVHARLVHGTQQSRWAIAREGLTRFVREGWGDKAALLGWTADELYRVPALWSQIWLTGAALLVGDRKVIAVTEDSIVIEASTGSQLKFRRLGREHLA
jgi:hypothetical protein